MRTTSILSVAIGALSFIQATPVNPRQESEVSECGAPPVTTDFIQLSKQMLEEENAIDNGTVVQPAAALKDIVISVWFHVVATGKTKSQGWVTDAAINGQVRILNKAYAPHQIQFKKGGVTRTVNSAWSVSPDTNEKNAMWKNLRKGTYKTLNIYIQKAVSSPGVAGYCYYPVSGITTAPSNDGCSINSDTLPNKNPDHTGYVAVHEVGHWLGLRHTFDGNSCTGEGDLVSDTPVHLQTGVGSGDCQKTFNTCPNQKGNDPIHNYMNYVSEWCQTQFTKGQQNRMRNMWWKLRSEH